MRVRRAATCVAVARTAIASGRMFEAIDRLEEACALDPNAGEARLLLEELRLQETAEERREVESRPSSSGGLRGWSHWVAAGIAICALAALAFFWVPPPLGTGEQEAAARQSKASDTSARSRFALEGQSPFAADETTAPLFGRDALAPNALGTSGSEPPAPEAGPTEAPPGASAVPTGREPSGVVTQALPIVPAQGNTGNREAEAGQRNAAAPDVGSRAPAPVTSEVPGAASSPTSPTRVPAATAAAPISGSPAALAGSPTPDANAVSAAARPPAPTGSVDAVQKADAKMPAVAEPAEAGGTTARGTPLPGADVALSAPGVPASTAPVRLAVVPGDVPLMASDENSGEIQQTLRRYADAYTHLDADAALAVWPTVDRRALARAFEGLESQGIEFEHCDVNVQGSDATAACLGHAQFVPKVGSRRLLRERRQWTFQLRKADTGWQIVRAEAR